MNKFKSFYILIVYLLFMTLCTGCWDMKLYEEMGLILTMGIECGEEKMLRFTRVIPSVSSEKKIEMHIITSEENLTRSARELARQVAGKSIEGGKLQQIIFSKQLAEKGIHSLLEIFERSPANPLLCYVVIAEGSPKKLIEEGVKLKSITSLPFHINALLQTNIKDSYTVDTRIYHFDVDYFAEGIDPTAPLITATPEGPKVTGSALFSKDKMVGELNTQDTGLLFATKNKKNELEYIYRNPALSKETNNEKSGIAMTVNQKKRKLDINFKNDIPVIKITLNFTGTLTEYKWDDIDMEIEQKKLEEIIAASIRDDCNKMIKYLQKVGSDPIGLGEIVRSRYNIYWKSNDWKKMYEKAEVTVDVKLNISNYGIIN